MVDEKTMNSQISEVQCASADAPAKTEKGGDPTDVYTVEHQETARVHRRRRLIYFATLCFCFFFEGWSDGSFGPLLPQVQSAFGVSIDFSYLVARNPRLRNII